MPPLASRQSSNTPSTPILRGQTRPKRRIGHTKSRNGCYTCKNRRVKVSQSFLGVFLLTAHSTRQCDEERPICGACSIREDQCTYPPLQDARGITRRRAPSRRDRTSHEETNPGNPPSEHTMPMRPLNFNVSRVRTPQPEHEHESRGCLNMHDLNLLQHFILYTAPKLSLNPRKVLVWTRIIPDIAAKNAFLMHLLLALAGLHLLTNHEPANVPSTDPSFDESIHSVPTDLDAIELHSLVEHHQKGLQGLQEKLATADESDAEALFAGSMLIAGFAFASLRIETFDISYQIPGTVDGANHDLSTPSLVGRPQVHWLQLVRGTVSIVQQSWRTLRLGRLRPLLLYRNANDDWKLYDPDSLPSTSPPGSNLSAGLSAFLQGARPAISSLKGLVKSMAKANGVSEDGLHSSPIADPSPGATGEIPTEQPPLAQEQAIDVIEQIYMRIIYLLQLQPIEPSLSNHEIQAELGEAAITSWPHMLSEAFISTLDSDDDVGLATGLSFAILAHLYLPLALLDDIWFLGKTFCTEILKINAFVDRLGSPELSERMEWPVSIARLQGEKV
ncbi:hypothetical protein N7532_003451 [Penicillium argentinense]|uniref:Zn(2)-C6 fungal-type domain-containing protein n=1 Tax=Penicillium argentinense TaxID=1131581 RepID=A0A9W9FMX6_9EURO|nr:uncharacterized protein N7532_003451 [Penicillium argentinense]KAJ5102922.1 hypothetical protein N7532_003451 [Penicillium argentinense]